MKTFELDYTCNSRECWTTHQKAFSKHTKFSCVKTALPGRKANNRVSERRTLTAQNHKVQLTDSALSRNKNQIGPRKLHEVGP